MDSSRTSDVPQPPKQSAYNQSSNPVSQDPVEQRASTTHSQNAVPSGSYSHRYGNAAPAVHRTANSQPSSDDKLARLARERQLQAENDGNRGNIDTEYGIEQQPAEGDIAAAVEGKSRRARTQAGAHAGPVGSAEGPGYVGEQDTAAQMGRKREEHDRILGQRVGRSPALLDENDAEGGGVDAERQRLQERKLK